jgi:ankyrin repeat/IBR domain-containing protein 1
MTFTNFLFEPLRTMGITASARFRSALSRGDEKSALEIWRQGGTDFWDSVKPNESYGSNYDGYTPFLYCAKYGLENFISRFMNRGADVRVPNAKGETALHLLCSCNGEEGHRRRSRTAEDKMRYKLLVYIFNWKRPHGNGEKEIKAPVEVDALDKMGETALHKAAKSGLKECMEVLLAHGASVFVENKTGQTPCDCAEQAGLTDIAEFLETKMLFSESPEAENGNESPNVALFVTEEASGLRTQDVQEVKDNLLVETSDMLGIPLFTAEALLRNHGWDKQALLDAWMEDAAATCEQAGVHPPSQFLELGKELDGHMSRSHKDYDAVLVVLCVLTL